MPVIRYIAISLLLLVTNHMVAKPTLIQGNAFSYRGQELEIHRYLDLFTFATEKLDSIKIPQDGNFKLTVEVKETDLFVIKIGKVHAHLFVEPGDQYTLVMPEPLEMDRFNPAKDVFVQPEVFEANFRLNYHITELEKAINDFFISGTSSSYELRAGGNLRQRADTIFPKIKKEFSSVESPYFQTYMHFRFAEAELATRHSRKSVFENYFQKELAAVRQLSFANAFGLMFNDYMSPKSTLKFSDSLEIAISFGQYQTIQELLKTDWMLERQDFRDLVMVTELHELGSEKRYPLSTILDLLDQCIATSKTEGVVQVAKDSRKSLLKLAPGTRAPEFIFADVLGNLSRISDFEGRYIYIQFFKTFDSETMRQMSMMKVLKEGYGADIAMFSFSTSESLRRLDEIPSKHDFDWYFGKVGHPDRVIDDYDLRAMPQYFYFDKTLNIICNPTPPPGDRIERMFAKIWNEEHPNKPLLFKLQPPEISEEEMGELKQSDPTPP
ncbi:MAG: hypothetical protein R2813_05140 [Flavobacteriales bacterium]